MSKQLMVPLPVKALDRYQWSKHNAPFIFGNTQFSRLPVPFPICQFSLLVEFDDTDMPTGCQIPTFCVFTPLEVI